MSTLSLLSATDTQQLLAQGIRQRRQQAGLSRAALAEKSTVPAATLKKFETTGQISLRQFLLLWQTLADLQDIADLAALPEAEPKTIADVLRR